MTQKELIAMFMPILNEKGKVYRKTTKVYAKIADGGEKIYTETSDGIETQNVAERGDFIVENQTESEEQYVLKPKSFKDRYKFIKHHSAKLSEYQAIGKIKAIRLNKRLLDKLKLDQEFYFTAEWGEEMVAKKGDFLVCPLDSSEIYRIARKEFFETYQIDSKPPLRKLLLTL